MPRYSKREFQVGDYWLSQQRNSQAWCRTWFDPQTRQTRRTSLGTADFEEAKQALTDWFVANQAPANTNPEDQTLAEIVARYWERHGQHVSSANTTRISLKHWLDFFGERTIQDIASPTLQNEFHAWLRQRGMGASTVDRVLAVGRAAINFAWKRGEIASAPFILPVATKSPEAAPPMGRPLELGELASLLQATSNQHLIMFTVLMIATAARPDAVLSLTLGQCDVKHRLIKLNPDGRAQTKKYRPTVRMPESIALLLEHYEPHAPEVFLVSGSDQQMKSVRTAWRNARTKANLDNQVNPYSIRHTMARWLRKCGVPAWEVSAQLGHKRQELSLTEVYAPYDPGYLGEATRAIDSFFADLRVSCVVVDKLLGG